MFRVRLMFSKSGTLRYIGHLDFLRVFQQTIRRAGLPAAFSQGFNPHLLISFALPLPLGMESVNDYADITLENEVCFTEIVDRLNSVAPDGLLIKRAYNAENKAASVVKRADYYVRLNDKLEGLKDKLSEIMGQKEIIVAKKSKKGIRDTDIRVDLFDANISGDDLFLNLSAGSDRFLNPLVVAGLIFDEPCSAIDIRRAELYYENEQGNMVTL